MKTVIIPNRRNSKRTADAIKKIKNEKNLTPVIVYYIAFFTLGALMGHFIPILHKLLEAKI